MSSITIPAAEALPLDSLITAGAHAIASRVLMKTGAGNVTLFAFDAGQGLTEHSSPFDALVLVVEGRFVLTIGGNAVTAVAGTLVNMPAGVPHAVDAAEAGRMLLIMLK